MPRDPYRNFKFELEIDGFVRAGAVKITGLKRTTEKIEYREGGDNETPRKIPGQTTYEDLTISRGVSEDEDFVKWSQQVYNVDNVDGEQGPNEDFRKDVTIYLKDKAGRRVKKWKASRSWPCEDGVDDLDASANDILSENLVLCHEGLTGPFNV